MIRDLQPGQRVRVAEEWATKTDRTVGTVRQVIDRPNGGQWAKVRFDGYDVDFTYMGRELEPAGESHE